jgi:hypothetical protein
MDMTVMSVCEPTLLDHLLMDWLVLLFPVGALVLQPLRRRSGAVVRALVGVVTIFGVLMSPLALLITVGTVARILLD